MAIDKNAGAEKFGRHASGFNKGSGAKFEVVGNGRSKVIPEATAPHMTLMTAMAAMCYLAVLAIGALLMTATAFHNWTSQIASQVTVQISAADRVDDDGDA